MTCWWAAPCREATLPGLRRALLLSLPVLLGDCEREREYSDRRFFACWGAPKYFGGVPWRMGSALGLRATRFTPALRWKDAREEAGETARLGAGDVLRRRSSVLRRRRPRLAAGWPRAAGRGPATGTT